MTEFKQIIGRGTRLRTDFGKYFFTIIDFRKATELFADPEWDGPAIAIKEIDKHGVVTDVDVDPESDLEGTEIGEILEGGDSDDEPNDEPNIRFVVSGVNFKVIAERVQYYDKDGKLITESLKDFTRRAVGNEFKSLDQFRKKWNATERKQVILDELLEQGVILEALEDAVGRDMDPFDLICHVAFDQPPLTRKERVEGVRKKNIFSLYEAKARQVLDILLDKYADQGLETISTIDVLRLDPFTEIGTPVELVKAFGGRDEYLHAVQTLETEIYSTTA
jgi:type I restriction enzyme R subunit